MADIMAPQSSEEKSVVDDDEDASDDTEFSATSGWVHLLFLKIKIITLSSIKNFLFSF